MFDFSSFYSAVAEKLPQDATCAEVGVADGASAIFLAESLLNKKTFFKLAMIDSMAYGGPEQLNTIIKHVVSAGLTTYVDVLPFDSLNASCRFPDNHFDFIFIDASHRYEYTKADIRLWHRKVKEGGILAGHDYNSGEGAEVKQAVDEVIPAFATRTSLPDGQTFNQEQMLRTEETEKGYGVWWLRKRFYQQIN